MAEPIAQSDPVEELKREFRTRLKDARDHCRPIHDDFECDFDMVSPEPSGEGQWTSEDLDKMRDEQRPAITDNQVQKVVNAVSGSEITNRYEPKYLPRSLEDTGAATGLSETVRYIRQQCDAEHEESGAFRDAIICGMGVTEIYQDYLDNPDGRPVVERLDPREIMWDPGVRRANLADARYLIRPKWVPVDEFRALWPEKAEELQLSIYSVDNAPSDDELRITGKETDRDWMYRGDSKYYDSKRRRVLVYDYQKKERGWQYKFVNPLTQQEEFAPEEGFEELRKSLDDQASQMALVSGQPYSGFASVRIPKEDYKRAFFCGPHLLEDIEPPINAFTYTFCTAFEKKTPNGLEWYGIVRVMRDRQMGWNKMLSETVHRYVSGRKGAFGYEPGFFENPQKAMKDLNKPNQPIALLPGAKDKFVVFESGGIPDDASALLNVFANVSDPSGLSAEYFVGQAPDLKRTAGSAVQAVQRQNIAMLSPVHDNFRRYRKEMGRKFKLWIQAGYLTDQQLIRISGPEGTQYVPFQKDWASGEYDIVTEEAPTSPNKKAELAEKLVQTDLATTLMEQGIVTGDMIVEAMDFPAHMLDQAKKNALLRNQVTEAQLQVQLLQLQAQAMMLQQQMMAPPTQGQPPAEEAPQPPVQ